MTNTKIFQISFFCLGLNAVSTTVSQIFQIDNSLSKHYWVTLFIGVITIIGSIKFKTKYGRVLASFYFVTPIINNIITLLSLVGLTAPSEYYFGYNLSTTFASGVTLLFGYAFLILAINITDAKKCN